jgi:hypothetical protein
MRTPTTRQELEELLRRAFEIDRMLPKVGLKNPTSILGQLVVIPDDERSLEDIQEDWEHARERITSADMELWEEANKWLGTIRGIKWAVVKKRCQGMGWKRIASYLVKKEFADRHLHRATLLRYFYDGLDEIVRKI